MTPRQPLEALLGPLVHVEEPELKVQHRLAGDAKSKVARLDDPRMDGSDGHLEHAFTGHGSERVKITCHARHHGVVREVLAKRPGPLGPVVMEGDPRRVRMALRNEAEEIHDLAFEPVGHRIFRGDRRIRRFSRKHRAPRACRKVRRPGKNHRWCRRNRPLASRSSLAKRDRSRPLRPHGHAIGEVPATRTWSSRAEARRAGSHERPAPALPARLTRSLTTDISHHPTPRALPHG